MTPRETFDALSSKPGAKRQSDGSYMLKCAGHEDKVPSLHVTLTGDTLLLRCFAGCDAERILRGFGLDWNDVMPPQAKPVETVWKIRDASGAVVAEHIRLDDASGKKRFVWKRGGQFGLQGLPATDVPLYRCETLSASTCAVIVTEGERAADAAVKLGLLAVGTATGASATPGAGPLAVLKGRKVMLWPDADQPGREHMQRIAEALKGVANSVQWIVVPNAARGDDAADYRGTLAELKACVRDNLEPETSPLVMFGDRIKAALGELDRLHRGDFSRYVPTGVPSLDRVLGGGFMRGQVTLIGAPPGAGKTTLVVQAAMAAQTRGLAVVVSPEMSADELVVREVVRRSGWPKWDRAPWASEAVRTASLEAHVYAANELLQNPPRVAVYDSITVTLDDVIAACRAKREPISLIALDYAQQLANDDPRVPRYLAVGQVALSAIAMAREFDCPVIVTSQVNTVREKGGDKSYSIRESANLEQKANNVLLFLVERDDKGAIERAWFQATKVRDGALFKLDVECDFRTFRVSDVREYKPEVRDWTRERT